MGRSFSGRPGMVTRSLFLWALAAVAALACLTVAEAGAPVPLSSTRHPVDWWFVFKLNSKVFPGCVRHAAPACPFGGRGRNYRFWGQQYVEASSARPALQQGAGCAGDTRLDPIGATFGEIYDGKFHYVVWNDQFYGHPQIAGCGKSCGAPWGHSKGIVAWDDAGNGVVMQVTTPSWPASGSKAYPRKGDGDTLGCVEDDNVEVSQDFFSLRLDESDLAKVLAALARARVVTDVSNRQIVNNGGPQKIQALVRKLGHKSRARAVEISTLSSGVELIVKPSALHVPPWQLVSAELHGVGLRVASWWARPRIGPTTASTPITCWADNLPAPGPVEIALSGQWKGRSFGLKGGLGPNFNHAKVGISTSGKTPYVVFGDMNEQGALSGDKCGRSQNGRGGLFFVLKNRPLHDTIAALMSAPAQ